MAGFKNDKDYPVQVDGEVIEPSPPPKKKKAADKRQEDES